jgi:hypothetical protein
MNRTRLIVGLITSHRTFLTITKTRKGRPRPDPGCSATDDDDDDDDDDVLFSLQYFSFPVLCTVSSKCMLLWKKECARLLVFWVHILISYIVILCV